MRVIPSAFLVFLFLTGCYGYKEVPVEYDYSYKGKFTRYKTYDFFDLPVIAGDSSMSNQVVERTIAWRMKTLGYRQTSNKPNLLVSYKLFYNDLKLKAYDQPDIETWALSYGEEEAYKQTEKDIRDGTLVIQLFDRRQQRSVWQGYATNEYGTISFRNERALRNAVISILDKYRFLAEDFMEKEKVYQGETE